MKKRSKLYLILILIAVVVVGLIYFGILGEIAIKEQEAGPFKVVYETHIGDYSKVRIIQDEIYYSLIEDGITTTKGFGIYYDNPKVVENFEDVSILLKYSLKSDPSSAGLI